MGKLPLPLLPDEVNPHEQFRFAANIYYRIFLLRANSYNEKGFAPRHRQAPFGHSGPCDGRQLVYIDRLQLFLAPLRREAAGRH
jgi:hypothetical protein